jgi:dCMP deaminase
MSRDARWINEVRKAASQSRDRSTKTGCVIVHSCGYLTACNGFPSGVDEEPDERHERPAKYDWTEHAERNAIYHAAATGIAISGARLYVNWFPCADCARAIIQVGISELICGEPTDHPKYASEFLVASAMLREAGVKVNTAQELSK